MAGRHRSIGALRSWLFAGHPAQQVTTARPSVIEMVDAGTLAVHLVTGEAVAAGRRAKTGRYRARCGAEVLSASLTEPGRGRCSSCRSIPTQRGRMS